MTLARSLSLFTVIPVRCAPELAPGESAKALLWLPVVGAFCGALAALPDAVIRYWSPHTQLLGAVLSIAVLATITGCLHWDGLADTADGLGSRAPAERALQIMRQSDIGPFGVVAIVLVLAADIAALADNRGEYWVPIVALATAAATGRVAAVLAAMHGIPPAHASGFGVVVAGCLSPLAVAVTVLLVLACGAGLALLSSIPIGWLVLPQAGALVIAVLARMKLVHRFTGITGDIFGALIEMSTAVTLIGMALR